MISRIDQMEQREKIFLAIGAVFILFVIIVFGLYQPYRNALARTEKKIAVKQIQVEEVRKLQAEYQTLQNRMKRAETKLVSTSGLSALALVEDIASNIGGRENLSYIRAQPPQSRGEFRIENLDVKFEKLPLQQVVRLVLGIETSTTQMQVKNLRLKQRFDNSSQLDVTMTVSVFRRNQ
jgi:general secretion pathway protein M